ncbi:MAG: phosphocarrier protein HPr [Elusimicrobia bacterium RIFOXYA2_FULL_40_6]|nr:MAG: phosphocarrier protein HPr [Elusimicrobia bacterium RIFOXYA2_FULL_40_6]
MQEKTVIVTNRLGLHARPAATLVQAAARFKSKIKIIKDDQEVDGKSIMGIMTLAAAAGTVIRIVIEGEDESAALAELIRLFESGFGEQ